MKASSFLRREGNVKPKKKRRREDQRVDKKPGCVELVSDSTFKSRTKLFHLKIPPITSASFTNSCYKECQLPPAPPFQAALNISGACRAAVPGLQALQSFLHPLLVVLDHVRVHVDVVAADVPLRAPVGDGPEAEGGVVLVGLLELSEEKKSSFVCASE